MIYINNLFYTIVSQVGRRRRVLPFLDTTRDGNLPLKWQGGCENGSLSLLEVHVFGKCPKTYTLVLLLMYSTLVWSLTLIRAQDDPAEILTPSLYSDVQGEVLFGQSLVLIWPWLHINSDKHHFLCSHFIGHFLISIFPGCFLWGCPRRSLGTWTSSWRRRGATKHSSKATKPWDPGWRRRWSQPHVPADVKRYSADLYLSCMMLRRLAVFENLKLNPALNENMFDSAFRPERSKHIQFFTLLIFVKSTLSNTYNILNWNAILKHWKRINLRGKEIVTEHLVIWWFFHTGTFPQKPPLLCFI